MINLQQPITLSHQTSQMEKRSGEDVEVISFSPKKLTTNKWFECTVCNKRFARKQNLQLHLHGKLQKRDRKAGPPRRKVYVCPVSECAHNHPARALRDITAARRHYSRKHYNRKPFKCEACSKAYAVEADFKAHIKICRSRSFDCSCGTSFTKEEDFKTHKILCHAFIENEVATKSDERLQTSKGKRPVSLEKNSDDELSKDKGKSHVFSLYNFAPLDTSSPAFLDTTPPVEDNHSKQQRQNEYNFVSLNISNSLGEDLSPTFISSTPDSDPYSMNDYVPCLSLMEYETPEILSLSKDHPMMLTCTSSMTYPPLHETSSLVHGIGEETRKVKLFNQEISHGFRVCIDKNHILNANMKEQANIFPSQDSDFVSNMIQPGLGEHGATRGGLNSYISNGDIIDSNQYQHNGSNNGLNSSPNHWNHTQQHGNPFNGGEGSSSSSTTKLFGKCISTERADEVGGIINDLFGFGNWVNENQ